MLIMIRKSGDYLFDINILSLHVLQYGHKIMARVLDLGASSTNQLKDNVKKQVFFLDTSHHCNVKYKNIVCIGYASTLIF